MKKTVKVILICISLSVVLLGIVAASIWAWLPTPEEIKGCMTTKMFQVHLCPGSKDYVPLKNISSYMQRTVVMTEDGGFYEHHGFEWGVIEKNAREGWETGVFKKGGSTITQQLAKNMFLSRERTFVRKGLEALVTHRIEKTLNKKEILERYLNVVEFGQNIYGVKSAAAYYFKTTPGNLSVVQSAFLAMLLPSPIKYSSSYRQQDLTKFARQRIDRIITDMHRYHRISDEEYNEAVIDLSNFLSPAPPPSVGGSEGGQSIEDELNDAMFSEENSDPGPQGNDEIPVDSSEDLESLSQ